MPTPYTGRLQIRCPHAECPKDIIRQDVGADCAACESASLRIIDLSGAALIDILRATPETTTAEEPAPVQRGHAQAEKGKKKR